MTRLAMLPRSTVTVLIILVNGSVFQACVSDNCVICTDTKAICKTNNASEPIPQDFSTSMDDLEITFKCTSDVPVRLTREMFARYLKLTKLVLSGDFSGISPDALNSHSMLRIFSLKQTKATSLPDKLFQNANLIELRLIGNDMLQIPLNAFSSIKNPQLERMYVSENRVSILLPCVNGSLQLPEEFRKFKKLKNLSFASTHFHGNQCTLVGEKFFDVGLELSLLDVSGTNLFSNNSTFLKPLKTLTTLWLNDLAPYKYCPARAKVLLANLPNSLKKLELNYWENHDELNQSCLLTNEILAGLASLTQLTNLTFVHSDRVFGLALLPDTIPEFPLLETLNMDFCHLSHIDEKALTKYQNLIVLSLNGNLLETKDYPVFSRPLTKVKQLSMQYSSIPSDKKVTFYASGIMCSFPNLEYLDLTSNSFKEMPIFQHGSGCNRTELVSLTKFEADANNLRSFVTKDGKNSANLCLAFPSLKILSLYQNELMSVDGLEECSNLENLILYRNHLGYSGAGSTTSLYNNLRALKKLTLLDLSYNDLRKVDSRLLHELVHIKQFNFQNNNLYILDKDFFKFNIHLEVIDLSWNFISNISASTFSNMRNLTRLVLDGNQIVTLPGDLLDVFDKADHLTTLFLNNNPYDCSCGHIYFQRWANTNKKRFSFYNKTLLCGSPNRLEGQSVLNYRDDPFECYYRTPTIIAASIVGGFIITLLVALPFYRYRWYIKNIRVVWNAFTQSLKTTKLEYICKYDAYVSYDTLSEDDGNWVVNELMKNVEECAVESERRKLYVEGRDALPGESRISERDKALRNSRKIIIVASNSYLRSPNCLGEADVAGYQMHGLDVYQPNRILVLVREDLIEEEIVKPPMSSLLMENVIPIWSNASLLEMAFCKHLYKAGWQHGFWHLVYSKKRPNRISVNARNSTGPLNDVESGSHFENLGSSSETDALINKD